jgi:hypothetical protein
MELNLAILFTATTSTTLVVVREVHHLPPVQRLKGMAHAHGLLIIDLTLLTLTLK